jgi:diguanylate cyclase (GGDEF)-like protein
MGSSDDLDDLDSTCVAKLSELMGAKKPKQVDSQRPWVVIVTGAANVGKMFRLDGELVIGRSPDAGVQIQEDGVSRKHAKLVLTPEGKVQVVDMQSRNGTFVNGERVDAETLRDGDKIQIGNTTILKFSYQDALDEALQQNLYNSATRDPLTQVANKRTFTEMFEREVAFAARHARSLSLVMFDVDHFKRVNDTYGHPAGDFVLKRLAEVVAGAVRAEDVVARVGGEEFAIVLRDIGAQGAIDCAERLRRLVQSTTFDHAGVRIPVTVSLGVATIEGGANVTPGELVQTADARLYAAKQGGRNRVCGESTPLKRATA